MTKSNLPCMKADESVNNFSLHPRSRSRCHLKLGDADSALKDAESSLKDAHDFVKGLFQKAEALYAMGDFEFALVHYHRGNKLRPELNEFRLGIQKAREAIDNSIGSKFVLDKILLL